MKKTILKRFIVMGIVICMVFSMVACTTGKGSETLTGEEAAKETKIEWRAGHNGSTDTPAQYGLEEFARLLKEKSDGRIILTIYPNAQLGSVREMTEAVQMGTLDVMTGGSSLMTGFVEELGVFDLPYLISDTETAKKVFNGEVGDILAEKMIEMNLRPLGWWAVGIRNLTNSKKPINSLEDVKGMRIRIQTSEVFEKLMRSWGCDPVPMSWGDAFTAMQQGAVDGQENPLTVIYAAKVYEVTEYCAITKHVFAPAPLLISPKAWDALSDADKELVKEAAAEATDYQYKKYDEIEATAIAELEKHGMKFTYPDIEEFKKACEGIYSEYPQWSELIEKIRAISN